MSKKKKEYRIENRPHTIYRVVKSAENPYVMVDRRPIDNPALSFKAKGILTYLMSRPDGWEVSVSDLINHATDGDDSVRSGLKELRDAGHMKYTKMRERGRITGWLIEVFELPHADFPDVAFPDMENPTQVLSTLIRTEKKIEKERRKESYPTEKNFIASLSEHWREVSGIKPSRTLQTSFKRLFAMGNDLQINKRELEAEIIKLIDKTFLQNPELPENYMLVCVEGLRATYERFDRTR